MVNNRRELKIGQFLINDESPCYVIAEIGHNHKGDLETCKEMFLVAKDCGAHAVKLQKRDNKSLYTREMYAKAYNSENAYAPTYGAHREALEFGWDEYVALKEYAAEIGIDFFATAFDFKSADFLEKLGVPAYKIASGDLRSIPLLKHVAAFGKPIILSTGGGTMEDVQRAYDAIAPINKSLSILQCTAAYPAEPMDLNLNVISTFRAKFSTTVVGLSSHDNGIVMPVASYVLGGRIVEKHFTLNRTWKGTDHAFSLEPVGMKKMCRDLVRVYEAMGDGVKRQLPKEEAPISKMGKKMVAAKAIRAGSVLQRGDIALKSPADGLSPIYYERIVGQRLMRDLREEEDFTLEAFEPIHDNF